MPKKLKQFPKPALPVDPVGDSLADAYLFLLRKAAQRKRKTAQTLQADMGTGGSAGVADHATSDVDSDVTSAVAPPEFLEENGALAR